MSFETAKRAVGILLGLSVALCLTGLLVFGQGSAQAVYTTVAALACLLLMAGVALKWCRCPWCGALILRRLFAVKDCPACRRDLATGKKKKGKGGKR